MYCQQRFTQDDEGQKVLFQTYAQHLVSDQPPHMTFSIEEDLISSLCTDSNDLSRRPLSLQPIAYRGTGSPTITQTKATDITAIELRRVEQDYM